MLTLSKKLIYAIEAVLDIAYNSAGQPVQSGEISRRQGIPARYLEPVLQQLVRSGILAGVRGPRGGYRLGRERRAITLGEIVRVVRSLETSADVVGEDGSSDLGRAVVRPLWRTMREEWMSKLDATSIEDLCLRARQQGLPSEAAEKIDFTI
ncbi:MAG: Rrf2 family transcriptional regulator [Alphaproteobacteria bacterium]